MDSLIENFHIDIKTLIAQMINFAIVFLALYYLVIKSLLKTMQDRTEKIEKSLTDAEKIEQKLARTEEEYKKSQVDAKKEALKIIEKANEQAEKKGEEMVVKAKAEIGKVINKEKEDMNNEKAKVLGDMKKEIAELVVLAVEKVIEQKMNSKEDEEIIKKIIK